MDDRKTCIRTQVTPDGLIRTWNQGVMSILPVKLSTTETTRLYNSRARASAANEVIKRGRS